jgi:hypothetical protein
MKKTIMNLAVALVGLFGTTSANATVYFQSDFNGLPESTTSVNGGRLTLGAYGLPLEGGYGAIRNAYELPSGGQAFTIYGGQANNGANTGAISDLLGERDNGNSILRMTGSYLAKGNYNNSVAWNQTAKIQFQNVAAYFAYNEIVIGPTGSGGWQDFTLDLDLSGLLTDRNHIGEIQANFYMAGNNAGEFQFDNITIQTVAAIPEPSVASLLGFGFLGLVATRLRRRS